MLTLATSTVGIPVDSDKSISPLCQQLAEAVGVPFDSLPFDELSSNSWIGPLLRSDELADGIHEVRTEGFAILAAGAGRLAILVDEMDNLNVAVGVVPTTARDLLTRLVRQTLQLASQDARLNQQARELDSCIEQLSYNMEEQTWLRTLSDQMRLCDVSLNVRSVAEQLLTSLQGLIRAESLALFAGNFSTTGTTEDVTVTWVGDRFANDHVWIDWLADLSSGSTHRRTYVANHARIDEPLRVCGVQSLMAVRLQSSDRLRGWLVAVNRLGQDSRPSSVNRLSESEFGTVEASLADAAGTLMATHGHNVDLLHEQENLVRDVIRSISSAIDARDPYTRGHSDRVGHYAQLLARRLRVPEAECNRIYLCGLLHDVGKIGVPDSVLLKPGRLTDEEFDCIKQHPQIGHRIVRNLPQLADLLPGVLHHHEEVDGTGYPRGLAGEEIPYQARILAVADAYDAMTSDRPYRDGMSHKNAIGILQQQAGTQWDASIVHAFSQFSEAELHRDVTVTANEDQSSTSDASSLIEVG